MDETGLDDFGGTGVAGGSRPAGRLPQPRGDPHRGGRGDPGDAARHAAGQPPPGGRGTLADNPEIETRRSVARWSSSACPAPAPPRLSNLLAADPQIRSVRLWESSDPVPPPESATESTDPRIEAADAGARGHVRGLPHDAVPALPVGHRSDRVPGPAGHGLPDRALRRDGPGAELRSTGSSTATCPAPTSSTGGPPAPAVALPAPALASEDAGAHAGPRRPRAVLSRGQVRLDPPRPGRGARLGVQPDRLHPQLGQRSGRRRGAWVGAAGAVGRSRSGGPWSSGAASARSCFADVSFASLQSDPVGAVASAYAQLGIELGDGRGPLEAWAGAHPPGAHGVHQFSLESSAWTPTRCGSGSPSTSTSSRSWGRQKAGDAPAGQPVSGSGVSGSGR